jgi:sugar phosphate isomerase/epimerase
LLCGEGEFNPKDFVSKMLKTGYDGPWGIEVLNAELRKKPLKETVQSAFRTTRAQFPS